MNPRRGDYRAPPFRPPAHFPSLCVSRCVRRRTGRERNAAFLHRQIGVVEDRRARMPELRRSPAWPGQTIIISTDFRIILRRPQGDQIELGLVLHMSLEPLGGLSAIARRPAAAVDLAQDILRRYSIVFDLDVLEHAVGEAKLASE